MFARMDSESRTPSMLVVNQDVKTLHKDRSAILGHLPSGELIKPGEVGVLSYRILCPGVLMSNIQLALHRQVT